jgi:hypothetical protein
VLPTLANNASMGHTATDAEEEWGACFLNVPGASPHEYGEDDTDEVNGSRKTKGHRSNAFSASSEFVDATLPFQTGDCLSDLAASELFDSLFQFGIFVTHNLVQLNCLHARVLQLRENNVQLRTITTGRACSMRAPPLARCLRIAIP